MLRMLVRMTTLASWAAIVNRLVVRKLAFTLNPGVRRMFTVTPFPTRITSQLVVRDSRITITIVVVMTSSLAWLPVLALHQAHDAPCEASGKIPRPNAGFVSLVTCEVFVVTVTALWKRAAT